MAEGLILVLLGKMGSVLAYGAVKLFSPILQKEVATLLEAEDSLKHIAFEFTVMRAFLSQAELSEHDTSFEAWLKGVREVAHEVEDIIDEYSYLAVEYHNRSYVEKIFHKAESVKSWRSIAARLKEIETRLQKFSDMRPRYNMSFEGESRSKISQRQQASLIHSYFMNEEEPIGIEAQREKLVRWLTDGNSDHSIVAICGMGGLGKTTLAHNVFNSQSIKKHFECYTWVSVSQKYVVADLLKRIIKDVGGTVVADAEKMERSDLVQTVRKILEGKSYLLILDDVWTRDVWIYLRDAFVKSCHGSRIVITTRIKEVAALGGEYILELDGLGEKEAWDLFCRRAFKNKEKRCPEALEEWAGKIVVKCKGLPLALVAIGSLLSNRPKDDKEWRRFYDQFSWELSNNVNANEMTWVNKVINLSYNYLPSYLKSCFLYCSIFPEDYLIKRKRLIGLWVSEGFISVEGRGRQTPEELAEAYLNQLIQWSMLQVVERNSFGRVKACRMHAIVRESAVTISRKQDFHMMLDDLGDSGLHERARRLSIHAYNDGVLSGVNWSSLRTFLVLDCRSNLVEHMFFLAVSNFKYLRVLSLQGFRISHLPDSVTGMFNLHHLDLRDTGIIELPKLIGRLKSLQVLDLTGTDIQKFPHGISKLRNLRHLYFPIWLEFPEELCALQDLQTLNFHAGRQKSVGWIQNLTQLRCLRIYDMKAAHCAELWASIAKLCFISNLRIGLGDFGENRFMFEDMDVTLQHLQKLYLEGGISDTVVSSLFRFFGNSLRELHLRFSQLDKDPLPSLSYLTNLTSLQLCYDSYKGHKLCFQAGWFPCLKILELNFLRRLSLLEIEEAALQSLEELHLSNLNSLLVVPDGIKFLTLLKEIRLQSMPDEFLRRIKGEDCSKVPHIATIYFRDRNGVETNLEVLNLRYNYLPSHLKRCFLYCSMFPEDCLIKRKRLIRFWVSEGFISVVGLGQQTPEELAEAYFNELIKQSMLQVVKRNSFGRAKVVTVSRMLNFPMVIDDQRASWLQESAQHLAIHLCNDDLLSDVCSSSLRTLVLLGSDPNFGNPHMLLKDEPSFKSLRVLDLQGFPISHLPESVTELHHLEHVGLRYTGISELPNKMGRLKLLQVLDLSDTYIQKFPHGVTKLKNLRYLNFPARLTFSEELGALEDLQTLKFSAVRQMSVGWIWKLTHLRCLHIYKMKAADCAELLASIGKLRFLSNLRIMLNDPLRNRFMFEDRNDPLQHLQKLNLLGAISETGVPSLCRLFGHSLRELNLEFSQLNEDPLPSLSSLSNLASLKLREAYNGHQLCFRAGWFPRLKILALCDLEKINELETENGALQSLEELHLTRLPALLVVPDGFKFLTSLKKILLNDMPDGFVERIKKEVRSKVAHVSDDDLSSSKD